MHRPYRRVARVLIAIALLVSVAWLLANPSYEPLFTVIIATVALIQS